MHLQIQVRLIASQDFKEHFKNLANNLKEKTLIIYFQENIMYDIIYSLGGTK